MSDSITEIALKLIQDSNDVLETKEIQGKIEISIKDITRTKLFARLNNLRGEGLIKGKFVGPGKAPSVEEAIDLCAGVSCSNSEIQCPDGALVSCSNSCNAENGECSSCAPSCEGHESIQPPENETFIENETAFPPSNETEINQTDTTP